MARDAALRLLIMTRDDATASLARIEQGLARVGKQARTTRQEAQQAVSPKGLNLDVLASIPGLGGAMSGAGLVGLAGLAAKTTLELAKMGEESAHSGISKVTLAFLFFLMGGMYGAIAFLALYGLSHYSTQPRTNALTAYASPGDIRGLVYGIPFL